MGRRAASLGSLSAIAVWTWASPLYALDDVISAGNFSLDINGFIEGRAILSSNTQSWEDKGLGKVRYGAAANGDTRVLGRAEGAVALKPKFGFDVSGTIVLTANDQQRMALDINEAFLEYKPAPGSAFGFKARGGAFYPPISAENVGLAWTSPYTLTSSAINSWVGEELKTIGGEATLFHQTDDMEVDLTGALFMANDPTGTLLAWRGWSFNDRETGFFDRLQLAPIRMIRPGGRLSTQASTEKPFHEIDGIVGYYVGASVDNAFGKLSALWYDNRADDRAFVKAQWAWRTKFFSLSYKAPLPGDIDFVAQGMTGSTTVITIPAPVGPIVHTGFWSAFGLVSKDWGQHRLSFRTEYFKTIDRDAFVDNNNEHGMGLTLAYIFRPAVNQRVTLEVMHVSSQRPERAFLGFPSRARETQSQISYRFIF